MWEKYLKVFKPWKASNYAKWFNSTGENVPTVTYWYAHGASIIQNHKHQTNKQYIKTYQASESIAYFWVYGNLCKHCDIVTHSSPENHAACPSLHSATKWCTNWGTLEHHGNMACCSPRTSCEGLVFQPLQNKEQILVYKAPQQRPQTPCFLIFLTPRPFPGEGIHSKTLNLAVSSENAVFVC